MNKRQLTLVSLTAMAYGLAGALLYRARVLDNRIARPAMPKATSLLNSDLLVFGFPMALAFLAFTYLFWPASTVGPSHSGRLRLRALAMAGLAACITCWVYMVIAVNRYGE